MSEFRRGRHVLKEQAKTKKMSKEEIIELINERIEYYTGDEMKSINESVGDSRIVSELNDIKNKILNQNKDE